MKKLLFVILSLCFISNAFGTNDMLFYGYVQEWKVDSMFERSFEPKALGDVKISILVNEAIVQSHFSRTSGFYQFTLEPGSKYVIKFEKEGYFSKSFEVDAMVMELDEDADSFKMETDIAIFKEMPVDNKGALDDMCSAKVNYLPARKKLIWDSGYSKIALDNFLRATGMEQKLTEMYTEEY